MDADRLALQVFGTTYAGFRVVPDRTVMKDARRKNRYRCKTLPVCLGAEVRGERQFANIELRTPDHPAERLDQDRNIFVFDFKTLRPDRAVLERLGVSKRSENRFQLARGHKKAILPNEPGLKPATTFRRNVISNVVAGFSPRSNRTVDKEVATGLLELRRDGGDARPSTGFVARLAAGGTRYANSADGLIADHDRHTAAERDDIRELPLAGQLRIPSRALCPFERRPAKGARRIGLAPSQLQIVRRGRVAVDDETYVAGAVHHCNGDRDLPVRTSTGFDRTVGDGHRLRHGNVPLHQHLRVGACRNHGQRRGGPNQQSRHGFLPGVRGEPRKLPQASTNSESRPAAGHTLQQHTAISDDETTA